MKKNKIYVIAALVLLCASILIVLIENDVFKSTKQSGPVSDAFSVKDSSLVTKVFLADLHGNTVLLQRTPAGWSVNDSTLAISEKVESLLSVLMNLTVRQSVPQKAQSTINRMLSAGSVKVEIYQNAPKFKVFGIPFFVKERKVKTYFMGPATQDNLANFAVLEGFDEPYIVYVPGFTGFVTPTFSPFFADWITHDVFSTKITRINKLEVKDLEKPEESFTVVKVGTRFFDIFDYQNNKIPYYDTTKVIDMLSEYRDKNFESIPTDLLPEKRDSIIQFNLFKIITLTDVNNQSTELKLFRKINIDPQYFDYYDANDITSCYNRDKFYGMVDGDINRFYQFQFFHFDRQVQPLSYFMNRKE